MSLDETQSADHAPWPFQKDKLINNSNLETSKRQSVGIASQKSLAAAESIWQGSQPSHGASLNFGGWSSPALGQTLSAPRCCCERRAILPRGEVRYGEVSVSFYPKRMAQDPELSVLYNAQCPVCDVEIKHYARYAGEAGLPIRFDDLNTAARDWWGLDFDTAARRLYVRHDGVISSGVPAFLVLWSQMPRYRLLGQIVGLPGIRHIANAAYDHVFAPALYRRHRRRLRRQSIRDRVS